MYASIVYKKNIECKDIELTQKNISVDNINISRQNKYFRDKIFSAMASDAQHSQNHKYLGVPLKRRTHHSKGLKEL